MNMNRSCDAYTYELSAASQFQPLNTIRLLKIVYIQEVCLIPYEMVMLESAGGELPFKKKKKTLIAS